MATPRLYAVETSSTTARLQGIRQKSVKAKQPQRVEDTEFSETLDQFHCHPDPETKKEPDQKANGITT